LRECCDRADASLPPGRAKDTVTAVRERLSEDLLRVAVGGRLNAGKSTLVNALLGQKLAATDATECTKLVSWFTFGLINQVVVQLRNGQAVPLPAQPLATAVAKAGCPPGEIAVIEVKSSNRTLAREYTLVDTPGLDALSGLDEMSLNALSQADVLLYVMPHPGENDREALTTLRETAGEAGNQRAQHDRRAEPHRSARRRHRRSVAGRTPTRRTVQQPASFPGRGGNSGCRPAR
jgi:hypothetical protein